MTVPPGRYEGLVFPWPTTKAKCYELLVWECGEMIPTGTERYVNLHSQNMDVCPKYLTLGYKVSWYVPRPEPTSKSMLLLNLMIHNLH